MKISVIVPVYNSIKTLPRLLDSLLAQTFEDFEIILVNDGSTDGSDILCDEYSKKNSRIRVFHQENKGVAMARFLGINKARGEYSIHADSDDWVAPNMLQEMYAKIIESQADILISNYFTDSEDGDSYECKQKSDSVNAEDVLFNILKGKLFGALWNKLIKHSLYDEYNVKLYKEINYCEDVLVLAQILNHKDVKVSFIDKSYYHYINNKGSLTNLVTLKTYYGLIYFKDKLSVILPKSKRFSNILEEYSFAIFETAFNNSLFDKKHLRQEFNKVKPYIIKYKRGRMLLYYFFIYIYMYNIARKII